MIKRNRNWRAGLLPGIILGLLIFLPGHAAAADAGGVTAVRVFDFLNSIGANSAISRRGESLQNTIKCTKYLGISWFRSGFESDVPVQDLIELHNQTGARFSYGMLSGHTEIDRLINGGRQLAAAGALLAFEGNNEPNNWGVTYQGETGGGQAPSWLAVAKLQRDLYKAVKSDPVLKNYPVWNLSEGGAETDNVGVQFLTIPKGANTLMPEGTQYADYATCHNYCCHGSLPPLIDNQAWYAADPTIDKIPGYNGHFDGFYGEYGLTWAKKFPGYSNADLLTLPRVTTETGIGIVGPITEEMQARMYLSVYLSQFKRGWSYTSIYIMRDRTDESGNQTFGFYKGDYTPRKAAVYLHNLTSILADSGSIPTPGKLNYSIPKQPETMHDLLLQKSNGQFELVMWSERFASGGSNDVTVNLGSKFGSVKVYDPTIGTAATQTLKNVSSVPLTLNDHPVIIEFLP